MSKKAKKVEPEAVCHVLMAVDASGSMYDLAGDVRGGFNRYVDDLTELESADGGAQGAGRYKLTVATFNTEVGMLCQNVPLSRAPRLDRQNYSPTGGTALLDAIGSLVGRFRPRLNASGETDQVLVVVNTDGFENSSREWTHDGIRNLIADCKATGRWDFVFLGAHPDAWRQGDSMGMSSGLTVNTRAGTHGVYGSMARNTASYAAGQSTGADIAAAVSEASQEADREASGEK